MVVTRSTSGRLESTQTTEDAAATTATQKETVSATDAPTTGYLANQQTPAPIVVTAQIHAESTDAAVKKTPVRSQKSRRSERSILLARAQLEIAEKEALVARARAHLVQIEACSDDERDTASVTTNDATTERVTTWLNESHRQLQTDVQRPLDIHQAANEIVTAPANLNPAPPVLHAQPVASVPAIFPALTPYNASHAIATQTSFVKPAATTAMITTMAPSAATIPAAFLAIQHPTFISPNNATELIQRQQQQITPASGATQVLHFNEQSTLPEPSAGAAVPTPENSTAVAGHQTDLRELASAITLAVRAGQQQHAPRFYVDLPKFYGAHQEWLAFRAAYNESAPTFSNADNMARLRKSLRGRAKDAVESLLINSSGPTEIMKALENRFGRPDAIALAELERLRNAPRPSDAPKDICIFASRISNSISTLRALGKVHYVCNPEITKATIEKLTPTLRYRWFDFSAARPDEPDLEKLGRFLEREAELCGPYAQPETGIQENTNHTHKRTQKTFIATTRSEINCPVCDKAVHRIEDCDEFKAADTNARWDIAKKHKLCFKCLRRRKRIHSCRIRQCAIEECSYTHNRLLHHSNQAHQKPETVASTWARESHSYLKILPVTVSGPAGEVQTHALLDDGSTVTLIDAEIANEVGATGPIDPLHIEAISDRKVTAAKSRRVTLNLQGKFQIVGRTIENMDLSAQSVSEENLRGCHHLTDIKEQLTFEYARPKILIGQDNWDLLIATEVRKGQKHQPVASLTPLGWVLHGAHTRALGHRVNFITVSQEQDVQMDEQLREYFAIESLMVNPKRPQADPEKRALDLLAANTTEKDGHYETGLLWKTDNETLPNNYENALRRLKCTENRIDREPLLKEKYYETMEALIEKGYAERAPLQKDNKRTWYLPHFPVLNPAKPGKVRVVHDAAAKTKGTSLNDHLLTGPDLIQSLPGVIMRFRQHPVAVSADIAEMFMRVKIKAQDRDALRYLWRGNQRDKPPEEYRMTSLIFGATCSPSAAIYIKNVNAEKYRDIHPRAVKAIVRNHFVDDYLDSFQTEEEAIETSSIVRDIHKQAGYHLRKWQSNSHTVLGALNDDTTIPERKGQIINITGTAVERVLGLIWKPGTDELAFNLDLARVPPSLLESPKPTKREALKIVMSIFDPLGLASPVTSRAKQIIQETWRRGIGWDQQIDDDLAKQWTEWLLHLKALHDIAVPRCYLKYSSAASLQLHVFVDASETAYAASLYWRAATSDGRVEISLITAKARIAPLKLTSIPRLELQAAVLGTRIAATILEEHDIKPESKTFWSDSRTVLTWLKTGSRSYRPFVAHRIAAIEENSTVNEWRWIPTKMNVADDATRDVLSNFGPSHRWYKGPDFLRDSPDKWPTENITKNTEPTGEEKTYLVKRYEPTTELRRSLPDTTRFSKWEKLIRATARVLQFIQLCRRVREKTNYKCTAKNKQSDPNWKARGAPVDARMRQQRQKSEKISTPYLPINVDLLRKSEELLIRASQHESFQQEIESLRNDRTVGNNSRLRPLAVTLVNGTIMLKSRIAAADNVPETQKNPPVIDGSHPTVKLWIDYTHRALQHAGVETTINECRQYYWILRLRPATKMIVHRCIPCQLRKNTPPQPATGNHLKCRLAHHQRPFTYTGVDYFGPFTVTVGRSKQKRYVAIFTCLTTRAVHLEVAASLTADSAIMTLRRMIARRGCPTEIWSDNGTNLHAADRELRRAIDAASAEEAEKRTIRWCFIPPGAPFMGGAWERLVRAVKTALAATLNERHPTEEVLTTLLVESEYAVNSRPLTHVSVSPEDPEAITPNHFLLGGSARVPTPGIFNDKDLTRAAHWRASQRLADLFWARWVREYLPELQYRREPYSKGPAVKTGDVVLIADGTLPRNTWPRGIVTAVYPGPDLVVRAVDVKTKGGVLRRPVKKLIVLPTEPAASTTGLVCNAADN